MSGYLLRRLLQTAFVIVGSVTLIFFVLRLSGDPVTLMLPYDASDEIVERFREAYGLKDPVYIQYFKFLMRAFTGDFGTSLHFNRPALELVLERLPATLELALVSVVLTVTLSIPIGVVAAVKKGSLIDNILMGAALIGQSMPTFWLGVMAMIIFAVQLKLLPTSGRGGLRHLILPSISLAVYSMARLARVTRSSMLDVLGEDYIRTARGKGLRERVVIFRHAMRNASLPVAAMIGLMFAALVGGSVVIETVFVWPGIGRLLAEAVRNRDYPVAQAAVLVIALFVTAVNLLTDISYAYLDPRIRHE
ncbi:MAG: ABC transporter permease [Anaerolineae bacterium]|nr:MAG: ABC transporter permease [Anaerolineae bacterium]